MLKSKDEIKAGDTPLINLQNKIANNHVGADASVRPKQNRGITLIALIITIIFSYDEIVKSSNNKGFLLQTI